MVTFFREHGCHKLCVLNICENTFPDPGEETVQGSREGKMVRTLRPRIRTPHVQALRDPFVVLEVALHWTGRESATMGHAARRSSVHRWWCRFWLSSPQARCPSATSILSRTLRETAYGFPGPFGSKERGLHILIMEGKWCSWWQP